MKTVIAVSLLLFTSFASFAQQDSILQVEQTSSRRFIYLTVAKPDKEKGTSWRFLLRTYKDEVETIYSLDSIQRSTCHGWFPEHRNIQFVNDSVGFFYGTAIGYGYCAFVFRTDNGGRTWQQLHITKESYYTIAPHQFYMFNEQQGIALARLSKDTMSYYLTDDGGRTWQSHNISLNGLQHEGFLRPVYSADGNVVFVVERPFHKGRTSKIYGVLRSQDHGKTFKVLK